MTAAFYIAAAVAVVATFLAVSRRNAVHALLYLVVSLLSLGTCFPSPGRAFRSGHRGDHLRGRHHGALRLRGDDAQHGPKTEAGRRRGWPPRYGSDRPFSLRS